MTAPASVAPRLLPCPWCGEVPFYCADDGYGDSFIECRSDDCPAMPGVKAKAHDFDGCAVVWNRGAARPALGDVERLRALAAKATPGPWRVSVPEERGGDAGDLILVEREYPCINGLSAWFTLGVFYIPDEAAEGYTDGAFNRDAAIANARLAAFAAENAPALLAALAPADGAVTQGFLVGDIVEATQSVLASGCGRYPDAIVVNQSPLVIVSREGDMRWSCDLDSYGLVKTGDRASLKEMRAAIRRVLDDDLFPALPADEGSKP